MNMICFWQYCASTFPLSRPRVATCGRLTNLLPNMYYLTLAVLQSYFSFCSQIFVYRNTASINPSQSQLFPCLFLPVHLRNTLHLPPSCTPPECHPFIPMSSFLFSKCPPVPPPSPLPQNFGPVMNV